MLPGVEHMVLNVDPSHSEVRLEADADGQAALPPFPEGGYKARRDWALRIEAIRKHKEHIA